MLEPSEFLDCLHTIWLFTQFAFIVVCAVGGAACLLVLLVYHAFLCAGACAYCMMSREGIARLKAERRGRRRVLRVGVAEEEGRGQEEEQGLVTGEVKPREVGMSLWNQYHGAYEFDGENPGVGWYAPVARFLKPSQMGRPPELHHGRSSKEYFKTFELMNTKIPHFEDDLIQQPASSPLNKAPSPTATMSRTQPPTSPLPTDNAAGFVSNIFHSTACIEEAFRQEGGELRYLEKCWSDSAILQFILLGWIGIALRVLLFALLATFLASCIQGRRPWYVFVSLVKGAGSILGGLCSCFELDDEEREREMAGETEKGLGIVWQEEREGGGYFGSPKEKVLIESSKQSLTHVLTLRKGLIQPEKAESEAKAGE